MTHHQPQRFKGLDFEETLRNAGKLPWQLQGKRSWQGYALWDSIPSMPIMSSSVTCLVGFSNKASIQHLKALDNLKNYLHVNST